MSHQRILIVDDEPLVLKYAASVLTRLGYANVQRASCGLEARSLLSSQSFALVICDFSLPDADGSEILREALDANPSARGILITGYSSSDLQIANDLSEKIQVLEKPFTADDISQLVAETFERSFAETTCAH